MSCSPRNQLNALQSIRCPAARQVSTLSRRRHQAPPPPPPTISRKETFSMLREIRGKLNRRYKHPTFDDELLYRVYITPALPPSTWTKMTPLSLKGATSYRPRSRTRKLPLMESFLGGPGSLPRSSRSSSATTTTWTRTPPPCALGRD